ELWGSKAVKRLLSHLFLLTDLFPIKSRKKQRDEVDVVGVATSSEMSGASGGGTDGKTREQMIHERIGYKPHPKPNTLPSLFGNLQF
uniref:Anaphase-promoting complex subunit CDC26 n=1 Tax=Cyprinus carpio carpio TaxID=630221 RepID=A0A8C0YJ57_CYPCA